MNRRIFHMKNRKRKYWFDQYRPRADVELIAAGELHAPWIIVSDFLARARAWRILNPDSLLVHANGECEKFHVTNKFVAYFYTYVSEIQNTHTHARMHAEDR